MLNIKAGYLKSFSGAFSITPSQDWGVGMAKPLVLCINVSEYIRGTSTNMPRKKRQRSASADVVDESWQPPCRCVHASGRDLGGIP